MTSLSEAYDGGRDRWDGRDPRHVAVGAVLFLSGALALGAAIVAVTALVLGAAEETVTKRAAGTLAGLGIPAILLGVVAVLPASRRQHVGVVTGTALTVGGVALFRHAYPTRWTGTAESLAFPTAMLYFVGGSVALWFVLSAVATFKLRNNPQGTVSLEITRAGQTQTVSVSRDQYRRYERAIREGDAAVREELESLHRE